MQRTRCPCKTIITSRRTSMLFKTVVSAHRAFLNKTTRNVGLKNFMYAIIEVWRQQQIQNNYENKPRDHAKAGSFEDPWFLKSYVIIRVFSKDWLNFKFQNRHFEALSILSILSHPCSVLVYNDPFGVFFLCKPLF